MADLDSEFAVTEQAAEERKKALDDRLTRQQADDRSLIAKVIVFAFVGLIGLVVLAAIVGAYFFDWDSLVGAAKFLADILGSVMLPVVTLVIGYYFGKEK